MTVESQPNKVECRAAVRARRRARAGSAEAAGTASAFAAVLAEVLVGARTVIGYAALPGEPDLDLALDRAHAAGTQVLLPVTSPGRPLDFGRLAGPMADLPRRGRWRIREPERTVDAAGALAAADLLLVPGLAFSRTGARLGNGGGFYDRSFGPAGVAPLARGSGRLLGVCFAEEVVDRLPAEPWDLLVDAVVTESGVEHPNRGPLPRGGPAENG